MKAILLALLMIAMPASALFGAGTPSFTQYDGPAELPNVDNAAEPTIGIPWNTDDIFYMSGESTFRIHFEGDNVTWDNVTPLNSILNVDPMLHADPDVGRVWAGGLAGPCSIMSYSDDNGESWIPTGNMCTYAQFDHQSIGSGPYSTLPATPLFEHATYYCAQLLLTACTTSLDGGLTWLPFTEVLGGCGGLHGHIRVSRATGTAVVPDASCDGGAGFGYTNTDGLVWLSRTVEGSTSTSDFDPSLQFSRDSGWLYYGRGGTEGAYIAMSKDEGATWEALGGGHGLNETWLNVGALHDPPIARAVFSDVQAGDDDRAAFAFLGVEETYENGEPVPLPGSYQCDDRQELLIWHYYVALTYDAGQTWEVHQMTDDPVQVGGIWKGQGGTCRNILDFNDMDIDSTGRIYVAFADGCIQECGETSRPGTGGYRTDYAAILRQEGGLGLFAEYDVASVADPDMPGGSDDDDDAESPGVALPLFGIGIVLVAWATRRRS